MLKSGWVCRVGFVWGAGVGIVNGEQLVITLKTV